MLHLLEKQLDEEIEIKGNIYVSDNNMHLIHYGNYKNPTICSYEHVQYVSKLIQKVIFTHQDYTEALSSVCKKKDFVYLDPPYAPEKHDSFVSYTENGFSNHKEFFEICKKIKSRWCMSNSNVKLVTDAFNDYNIELVECKRAINSKKPNSVTKEVIIDNNLSL